MNSLSESSPSSSFSFPESHLHLFPPFPPAALFLQTEVAS